MSSSGYTRLPGPEESLQLSRFTRPAPAGEIERKTWVRFAAMLGATFFMTGLLPGQAVWVKLFADVGVFSSLCEPGQAQCSAQYMVLSNAFLCALGLSTMFTLLSGAIFDKYGGWLCGLVGGLSMFVGYILILGSVVSVHYGQDKYSSAIFFAAVQIVSCGARLSGMAMSTLVYFMEGRLGLMISAGSAIATVSSMQPVIMQMLIGAGALSVGDAITIYSGYSLIGTFLNVIACPPHSEYLDKSGSNGASKHTQSAGCSELITAGNRILRVNWLDHLVYILVAAAINIYAGLYNLLAGLYGAFVFEDPSAGPQLASLTVTLGAIVGIGVMPLVCALADRCGISVVFATWALMGLPLQWAVYQGTWTAQSYSSLVSSYYVASCATSTPMLAIRYAIPSRLGTTIGFIGTYITLLGLPSAVGLQMLIATWANTRDDVIAIFRQLAFLAWASSALYYAFFLWRGLPKAPILLPEDEVDICMSYGCKFLDEVLYVLQLEDREVLRSMLGSSDPSVHFDLVMQIDSDRIAEKMQERSVEELICSIQSGIVWLRQQSLPMERQYSFGLHWETEQVVASAQLGSYASLRADLTSNGHRVSKIPAKPTRILPLEKIVSSLEAKQYSKRLCFLLHMEDAGQLEHWLLSQPIGALRLAFQDLWDWPEANPEMLFDRFTELVPEDRLVSLLRMRHELKPFVIDVLKADLLKMQKQHKADKWGAVSTRTSAPSTVV